MVMMMSMMMIMIHDDDRGDGGDDDDDGGGDDDDDDDGSDLVFLSWAIVWDCITYLQTCQVSRPLFVTSFSISFPTGDSWTFL